MEKSDDSIAVEINGGVVGAVALDNGGVKETAIGGSNKKVDAVTTESDGVSKKVRKMKKVFVSKVVSGGSSGAADGDMAAAAAVVVTSEGGMSGCRIQVSNTKKPLFFYVNLAKRYLKHNSNIELSALGMAIPTVVTIAEILKKDGWATEKDITISSVPFKDDTKGRVLLKSKIGILLEKTKKLEKDEVVAAKGPSEICEDETKDKGFLSEESTKLIEGKSCQAMIQN